MKNRFAAVLVAALVTATAGCSLDSKPQAAGEVTVVVGYQSKTINTATAGALLKAKGFLEKRLDDITKRTNVKYTVQWQDYDTGAPITAQMLAEKIDIGSIYVDHSRLSRETGWAPSVGLREGLARTIEFYREHGEHYWH